MTTGANIMLASQEQHCSIVCYMCVCTCMHNSQSNHVYILLQSCSQGFLESKMARGLDIGQILSDYRSGHEGKCLGKDKGIDSW